MNRHLQRIKEIESKAASRIRAGHARELEVVDAALDQVLRGLEDLASRKRRADNRLESARFLLASRSFNSLWVARQTLERGYHQQALVMVRMAMEDQLVLDDAENHPATLAALFDDEGKLGRGNLALGEMAERISPNAKEAWDKTYGFVSKAAVHPRRMSMLGVTSVGPDGQVTLRPGGVYDKVVVDTVVCLMLRELIQVMKIVAQLTDSAKSDWLNDAMPVYKSVEALYRWMEARAVELMNV